MEFAILTLKPAISLHDLQLILVGIARDNIADLTSIKTTWDILNISNCVI